VAGGKMNFVIPARRDNAVIKQCLISVFELGCKSPMPPKFREICKSIALNYFWNYKNRKELLDRSGLSADDIAYHCIGRLFQTQDGKFIRIENHFRKVLPRIYGITFDCIMTAHEDKLVSILVPLVRSRTKQELSSMADEHGELYPKIRNSLDRFVERNSTYLNEHVYLDEVYLFNGISGELDFSLPVIERERLLDYLFGKEFTTFRIPELSRAVLEYLGSQEKYMKAISYTELLNVLNEFYKRRGKDRGYDFW